MAKLTVNVPYQAPGAPIQIVGLGVFPNGSVTEVEALEEDLTVPEDAEPLEAPKKVPPVEDKKKPATDIPKEG